MLLIVLCLRKDVLLVICMIDKRENTDRQYDTFINIVVMPLLKQFYIFAEIFDSVCYCFG